MCRLYLNMIEYALLHETFTYIVYLYSGLFCISKENTRGFNDVYHSNRGISNVDNRSI